MRTIRRAHAVQPLTAIQNQYELREFTTALNAIPIRGDRVPAPVLAGTGVEAPMP